MKRQNSMLRIIRKHIDIEGVNIVMPWHRKYSVSDEIVDFTADECNDSCEHRWLLKGIK